MNRFLDSSQRSQELSLQQFHIRKKAKLCVCIVYTIQFLYRFFSVLFDPSLTPKSRLIWIISLPLPFMMIAIICLEYFSFKKIGPKIVRYSYIVDILLLSVFTADWLTSILSSLYKLQQTDPPCFKISALYGFTTFAWRTLMITLIVSKWQLKIIAPITATLVVTGFAIHYSPDSTLFMVLRASMHIFNIFLIIYFEDKVKWRLMRTNVEQEKWMQVNNFILDSIPENVMILDFAGEARFTSEYCKHFLEKYNFPVSLKDFFKKVRDLQQQYEPENLHISTSALQIERLTTCNRLFTDYNEASVTKVDFLEDLISNFPTLIKERNLQEKQFLVYNGKLNLDGRQQRSIEVKISFVQHFENDYIVLIFRDTTQRDLVVKLEETNKYKDQLLASVSHELRAPLNGNINLVEGAIHSSKIPNEIKESLLIPALRSSKFLLHLINDILDMSQIKEKKLRLAFHSTSLEDTLKNTAQLVDFQARMKGLEFSVEIDPEIPKNFCTDHLRLSQIILNLLTNAVKFTIKGTIKLTAQLIKDKSYVEIRIEDSGIGITQENMTKLFLNHPHTIDFEEREKMNPTGVGLGLNITSHLVQMLAPEGYKNITVTSTPKQGSIFTFILENKLDNLEKSNQNNSYEVAEELVLITQPKMFEKIQTFASSSSLPSAIEKSESHSELLIDHCSCPKVLIVDDNPFNIMALETILKSLEVKCDSVYSGSAALDKLQNIQTNYHCGNKECKAYSVIFMDQEMPEMSGSDTVREIKKLQDEGLVPLGIKIIGCTAHKAKEEVDKFLASGLDSCIFKPVSIVMIKEILKEIEK